MISVPPDLDRDDLDPDDDGRIGSHSDEEWRAAHERLVQLGVDPDELAYVWAPGLAVADVPADAWRSPVTPS